MVRSIDSFFGNAFQFGEKRAAVFVVEKLCSYKNYFPFALVIIPLPPNIRLWLVRYGGF